MALAHTTGRLHGILPVLATPFVKDSSESLALPPPGGAPAVAESDMVRIVDFVLEAGAQGVVFPGVASEFSFLTVDERQGLTALVSERVAGRVPLVVGASAETAEKVIQLAEAGVEHAASAAMVLPPAILGTDAEAVIDFLQTVSLGTQVDLILQNAPPPAGAGLSVETIAQVMAAVPQVQYVKEETLPSGQRITQLRQLAAGHLRGIMGGGGARYVIDELNRGACGAMPACELTDIHVALLKAHQAGDTRRARQLYNRTLPLLLFQAVFRMRMTKEVLSQRGIIRHAGLRAPIPPLDEQDRVELTSLVDEVADLFTVAGKR